MSLRTGLGTFELGLRNRLLGWESFAGLRLLLALFLLLLYLLLLQLELRQALGHSLLGDALHLSFFVYFLLLFFLRPFLFQ